MFNHSIAGRSWKKGLALSVFVVILLSPSHYIRHLAAKHTFRKYFLLLASLG